MRRKKPAPAEKYRPKTKSMTVQTADSVVEITTEVYPRTIDFNDILAAVVVDNDNDADAPWEDCDGWEHEIVRGDKIEHRDELEHSRGRVFWDREYCVIRVDLDTVKKRWMGAYSPLSGETRQAYEERIAKVRRSAVKQLVDWYAHGWTVLWVHCDFLDAYASVGGVYADDEDDAHVKETKTEIASEVAAELKDRGFEISNAPEKPAPGAWNKLCMQQRIARNMGFDSYEAYKEWLHGP